MIFKTIPFFAAVIFVAASHSGLAQEPQASDNPANDAANDPSSYDEERITVLDQTAPVAPPSSSGQETVDEDAGTGPSMDDIDLSDRERLITEFERYKELIDAGVYDEAENAAKLVVEMSIRQLGPTSTDTAKALSNLGLVQHKLSNFDAAQQNFQSAVEILSDNEDKLSESLINPMKGLAAAQLESGRPDLAAGTYQQAVHLSHVNSGPHNVGQIDILEALAETHLRLGQVDDAKNDQDMIYALNLRHHSNDKDAIVQSLMRRAKWQRRTGHVLDERATYRRIIRLIEIESSKTDIALIGPLTQLGSSYFFTDTSQSSAVQPATIASGEMFFKRAVRIAEENEESDWQILANAKLSLADYYNFKGDTSRSRKNYSTVWDILSEDEARIDLRRRFLESATALHEVAIPRYIAGATANDVTTSDAGIREGRIVASYDISSRGRVKELKIVEADPAEFEDLQKFVVRTLRSRVFRPRFVDSTPTETPNQIFTHSFYYRQDELDKLRSAALDDES